MKFTIRGRFYGDRITVTWEDGVLSSSEPVAAHILTKEAEHLEGEWKGMAEGGPGGFTDHINNPYQISAIIMGRLGMPKVLYSDVPVIDGGFLLDESAF